MNRVPTQWKRALCQGLLGLLLVCSASLSAATLTLKDGRTVRGEFDAVPSLAQNPKNPPSPNATTFIAVDDNLRRIFFSKQQVSSVDHANEAPEIRIPIEQKDLVDNGARIATTGPMTILSPWDNHGRRRIRMISARGTLDLVQGITLITPTFCRVELLRTGLKQQYMWDMRLATTSIPWNVIQQIVTSREKFDPKQFKDRVELVKLALQMERFGDAASEIQAILKDFPQEQQLDAQRKTMELMKAKRILQEIDHRQEAGQHQIVLTLLKNFPTENAEGQVLVEVKQRLESYEELRTRGEKLLKDLKANYEGIQNNSLRAQAKPILEEIEQQLNINTLDVMADFARLSDDPQLSAENKFALATNDWLLGSNSGGTNINLALALYDARNMVREYLRETDQLKRDVLLKQIRSQEGVSPVMVTQLLKHLAPPMPLDPGFEKEPGLYELSISGKGSDPRVNYWVQLPPDYDPLRFYPAVVTLHDSTNSPLEQIDWWAGVRSEKGPRQGQATRHGYIVVAIAWTADSQTKYEYSRREHATVLGCVRDAMRHFAIDSDRVFLSGHSMGGDAAWDIGFAHPDVWAGVIPIVATADKYCKRYWENAKQLPMYVVGGEMDGNRTVENAGTLDPMLRKGFDVTVVEYQGRGHENFSDEVARIFDWMSRRTRTFENKKITVTTMREWDNAFWWLEFPKIPENLVVDPIDWPPKRGYQQPKIDASIKNNVVTILTGPDPVTIWLSPELVDFSQKLRIVVKGNALPIKGTSIEPDLATLLEDARTRGDRKHPFWRKFD